MFLTTFGRTSSWTWSLIIAGASMCRHSLCGLTPAPSKVAVRQSSPRQRMRRAELLAAQFRSPKQRLRSPSNCPLRRRSKGPATYAQSGSRQVEAQKRARSGERPPGDDAPAADTKRWWYPLTQARSEEPTSTKTGADLKVLEPQAVKSGVVVEVTKATDAEEGPEEPDPTEERTFHPIQKGRI